MFREIHEISEVERLRREREERERWLRGAGSIKPETDITVEEARSFINNLFMTMGEA